MRTIAVRLRPGQDLKRELTALTAREAIQAGWVLTCVGSLSRATLRLAGGVEHADIAGELEILSLTGTLSTEGNHLHLTVADARGATFGGHLTAGCTVRTTAELVLAADDRLVFGRERDPATGYDELVVRDPPGSPEHPYTACHRFAGPGGTAISSTDRAEAERLDRDDPLAPFRERFVIDDPELLYLDGNSLGRLPRRSLRRLREVVEREWGQGLIRSWNEHWMDLPARAGDLLGEHLLGAAPGQVVVSDSTSVNLYKLAVAALDARPGRTVILSDSGNFPTDRYVLEGLAAARGVRLELVDFDERRAPTAEAVARRVDQRTALVSLSHVDYRSGALADMAAINAVARDAGALTLWDLCHSAGSVPVELDRSGADLAVGCTYKYLNAGPGAPAFLYVRREHSGRLRQPIWGWFGQREQFAMAQGYDPAPDISRFLVGTTNVLGVALVEEGAALLAEAGIQRLRAKGVALTELLIALHDAWLAPLGLTLASPRDASARGSHVAVAHPEAYRICRALVERAGVIPDFRAPDRIRLGPAPITTRFVDVWDAMDRLRAIVADGVHLTVDPTRARVT